MTPRQGGENSAHDTHRHCHRYHDHQLLVLFLEELAADAAAVHCRAAAFVGLAPTELSFSSFDGGSGGDNSRGGGVGFSVVNRGGASQAIGCRIEERSMGTRCGTESEGEGNGGKERPEKDEKQHTLLLQLDEYYKESIHELNELLLIALGVRNTWWPRRTPASF